MRDLKRTEGYGFPEQEGMYPFEREFHLQMIRGEKLKDADVPAQGWTQYAKEIGADKPVPYRDKYTIIDEAPSKKASK